MPKKHTMPAFLDEVVTPDAYERWLKRKATAQLSEIEIVGISVLVLPTAKRFMLRQFFQMA